MSKVNKSKQRRLNKDVRKEANRFIKMAEYRQRQQEEMAKYRPDRLAMAIKAAING